MSTSPPFRYINGKLFEEFIPLASLDRPMRETILDCSTLDWSRISPAIFGALFQSIMDKKGRRNLGAHYTNETNILKALQPLFLDNLRAEFERVRRDLKRLGDFHEKLRTIRVLDPACGCGNFLVIAYRELRRLELDVLRELFKSRHEGQLDVSNIVFVDVDQFYGIKIEEFPAQIAQVALWMTDHQMNQAVSAEFGQYFARLPLKKAPEIRHDNALTLDWKTIVNPKELSYIVGNPPFVGAMVMDDRQRADMATVFAGASGSGVLDYVAAWYLKTARYLAEDSSPKHIRCAFVSTNSIVQGEQVAILWNQLYPMDVHIDFAHRTFQWTNEGRGVAAVHCIIIGFSIGPSDSRFIFEYATIQSEPTRVSAKNINAYLVDAADLLLVNRDAPICDVPPMRFGNMPRDDGGLLLDDAEKRELLRQEPGARPFIRPFLSAREFLNGIPRWCLWLVDAEPTELRSLSNIRERINRVREFRLKSKAASTRGFANTPGLFAQIAQPMSRFLLVPRYSSENRAYIPLGFFTPRHIVADSCLSIADASPFHFGILSSSMHMAWVRATCGRLESRYRYSKDIVYNNFPWPEPTAKQKSAIETAAQAVLDERESYPKSTLADLYDPLSMPPSLAKTHQTLDRVVDAAYGKTNFSGEAERVAFLFTLYESLTTLFPTQRAKPARRRA